MRTRIVLDTSVLIADPGCLHSFPGCDGLKTGWTEAADASIVTTAKVGGHRVIAVAEPVHKKRKSYLQ